jgi:hypothetical protein
MSGKTGQECPVSLKHKGHEVIIPKTYPPKGGRALLPGKRRNEQAALLPLNQCDLGY